MKILFTGGGTMGSVTPLLAIKETLEKEENSEFLWIGTSSGPEKQIVKNNNINYKSIPSGKLRRYFSWRNFTDPILILLGFFKSLWIIFRFKPQVILTAGSFVCVPVAYAGKLFKVPIVVHQQDLEIGLANKLMLPVSSKITVAVPELREKFQKDKVVITGNPARSFLSSGSAERAQQSFFLEQNLPTVLIMGGGVGSEVINKAFIEQSEKLTKFCQVLHLLGKGKQAKWLHHPLVTGNSRYHAFEFLDKQLADAYAVAKLVFGRAGFSTLTECSSLSKPAIIMPIPKNQQVKNAEFFYQKRAIVYVQQEDFNGEYIVNLIKNLLEDEKRLQELGENIYETMPQHTGEAYLSLVKELMGIY